MALINRIDQLTNREDKAKFFQEVRMIDNPLATDIKRARELEQIEREERLKAFAEARENNDIEKAMDTSQPLWVCCKFCHYNNFKKHLRERVYICIHCAAYLPMSSYDRVDLLIDKGTWEELDETLSPIDTLKFYDDFSYAERLYDSQKDTKMLDALLTGFGMLDGYPVALGVMDFHFMGGSMGAVVGEKITRLIEFATYKGLPLILVCASGGARMQEGALSLMQMAKISAALEIYHTYAKLFHISVLTSPTTGGVTASFGMLADMVIAEPNSVIAFAGKRIIENILNMEVSDEFQTAENMYNHGILDNIITRQRLKSVLSEFLHFHANNVTPFKHKSHLPNFHTISFSLLNQEKYKLSLTDQKKELVVQVEKSLLEISALLFRIEKQKFLHGTTTQSSGSEARNGPPRLEVAPTEAGLPERPGTSEEGSSTVELETTLVKEGQQVAKQSLSLCFTIAAKKRRLLMILQKKRGLLTRAQTRELSNMEKFLQLQVKPSLELLLELDQKSFASEKNIALDQSRSQPTGSEGEKEGLNKEVLQQFDYHLDSLSQILQQTERSGPNLSPQLKGITAFSQRMANPDGSEISRFALDKMESLETLDEPRKQFEILLENVYDILKQKSRFK